MGTLPDLATNASESSLFNKSFNRELKADIFQNSGSSIKAFKRKAMV